MLYLGIDPGLDGAVAALNENGRALWVAPTPTIGKKGEKREYDEGEMLALLQRAVVDAGGPDNVLVAIELVGAMPGQGGVSMFRFGCGWGQWRGLCRGFGLRYELIAPKRWQKQALADVPGACPKARAECAAKMRHARFCADVLPKVATTKDAREGVYDALGIAEGQRRIDRGGR